MKSTIIVKTISGNNYYIDQEKRLVGYAHPSLVRLSNLEKQNGSLNELPDKTILSKNKEIEESELYYIEKHHFLAQHGVNFNKRDVEPFGGKINSETIDYTLSNLAQLTFELTDKCNLDCKYCGYSEFYNNHDKRNGQKLSFGVAKRMIDYVFKKWNSPLNSSKEGVGFISFYGGEPLLCVPLMKEIIEYIKSKKVNREIVYSMTTNGVLLNKYMDFLVENKIKLTISLDGNKKNNSYRVDHKGNASFNKIFNNIKLLKERFPKYFDESVFFNTVLHNRNSVEEVYSFFEKEFGKITNISELNNSGIKEDKIEEFIKTYKNYREDIRSSKHYEILNKKLLVNSPDTRDLLIFMKQNSGVFFSSYTDLFDNDIQYQLPTGTCLPFGKKLFVTVNGKILPCETIGHQFSLGRVTEESVNLDFNKIAEKYNNYFDKVKKQCKYCYASNSCTQCIYMIESIDDEQAKCDGFANDNTIKQQYSDTVAYLEDNPFLYNKIIDEVIFE